MRSKITATFAMCIALPVAAGMDRVLGAEVVVGVVNRPMMSYTMSATG